MTKTDLEILRDKAKGAFIGLAIGDALGVETEGKNFSEIQKRGFLKDFLTDDPVGSDDTEFAVFNTLLLKKYGLGITANEIALEWKKQFTTNQEPLRGAGFSELMTIENLRKNLFPPLSGFHSHSWSDGLAMRVLPFGIVSAGDNSVAAKLVLMDGSVSHTKEGIQSGLAVAVAISSALLTNNVDRIFKNVTNIIEKDSWTHRNIIRAIQIGSEARSLEECFVNLNKEIVCDYYHWSDIAPEAIGLSFGILAYTRGEFKNSVLGGVNIGRDTDTIAGICGAITGTITGYKNLPSDWTKKIQKVKGICIKSLAGTDLLECSDILIEVIEKNA